MKANNSVYGGIDGTSVQIVHREQAGASKLRTKK